jgi:hypothetical protein
MKKIVCLLALTFLGCGNDSVPSAYKGRMFNKTGPLAFYAGGKGFEGTVLGPGTYYTGVYNTVIMIQCAQQTKKEELKALTKDGVQFSLDVYVRFSPNCEDNSAVEQILNKMSPGWAGKNADPEYKEEWDRTIYGVQLYDAIIRPQIGESVRKSVSPYIANEINQYREKIFDHVKESFLKEINEQKPKLVDVLELNLSNLDFPEQLDAANVARAEQAILKDKAIAEREKVTAEIETTNMRKQLAESESRNQAVRIDELGAALKRNPEYLQLQMIKEAAEKGNMIIVSGSNGPIILQPKK